MAKEIKKVAIVGTGVIGAGWAARCLWRGFDVIATDPSPNGEASLREVVKNSEPALYELLPVPAEKRGKLTFTKSLEECVKDADYIQESAPENYDIKISLLNDISKFAKADAIIGSSTSGLLPSKLQEGMINPERLTVAHPFNPVYLLPLVEVCGGKLTSEQTLDDATEFYKTIGMRPLRCRVEIDGFIADRLLEALWREILWLVNDGVATTEEIDDAIVYGAGLRWCMMGTNFIYLLAGGKSGMRHFMEQFGPALKFPWCHLDAPELTDDLIDKMVEQTANQQQGRDFRELEALRDNCLVSVMKALSTQNFASGKVILEDAALQKKRLGL